MKQQQPRQLLVLLEIAYARQDLLYTCLCQQATYLNKYMHITYVESCRLKHFYINKVKEKSKTELYLFPVNDTTSRIMFLQTEINNLKKVHG